MLSKVGKLSFSLTDDMSGHSGSELGESAQESTSTSISSSSNSSKSSSFSRNSGTVSTTENTKRVNTSECHLLEFFIYYRGPFSPFFTFISQQNSTIIFVLEHRLMVTPCDLTKPWQTIRHPMLVSLLYNIIR